MKNNNRKEVKHTRNGKPQSLTRLMEHTVSDKVFNSNVRDVQSMQVLW